MRTCTAIMLIAIVGAATVATRAAEPSAVDQASYSRTEAKPAKSIRFNRQAPRVGDQVEQVLSIDMRLSTSMRQGNELREKNDTTIRNRQRRLVTTTAVVDGRTQAVLVRYVKATKQLDVDAAGGPVTPQPVEGKAYRCERDSSKDAKLMVTDDEGHVPPLDEFEIVTQNMEMVGRPNPLADFLAGRSVAVGETLKLPQDVADRLFAIGDRFGDVTRFDLTLEEVRKEDGAERAVFQASVEASSNSSSQMRMQVEGPLVVEVETCRAVSTKLLGPIGMSQSRGSYSTAYQLIGTGKLTMSIDAIYRDAAR